MADASIVSTANVAAPEGYTLQGTNELLLKAVRATIDGSGTATAYLPALQLLDPNGNVMWTAVGSTVAAGASADVSWFPGLGGGSSASSAFAQWFIARRTSNLSMSAGTTDTIPWSDLNSSDSSLFSLATVTHANDAVQVAREGVVFMTGWLIPDPAAADFVVGLLLNSTNGVSLNTNTPNNQYGSKSLPGTQPRFGPTQGAIVIPDVVPYNVFTEYHNDDVANHNLTGAQMWGLWWPTETLSPF
jgi:hypothetical protein